tara:strand:- start:1246 stop:1725 length:480 start_codon:yes stop_codon:yes gene_type:complete
MGETMMIIIEGVSDHSQEMKGNGKNGEMDVMGYQTQNFHICPGAQEAFSIMTKEGHRGEEGEMVANLAMLVDEYLGLEIQAKESGATPELISSMVDKGNSAMFHLGVLASSIGDESMIQLFNFMPDHVLEAIGMESEEPISMEEMGDGMSIEVEGGSCP